MVCLKDKFVFFCFVIIGFGWILVLLISEEGNVVVEVKIEDVFDLVVEIEGICRQVLFQDIGEVFWFYEVVELFDGFNQVV